MGITDRCNKSENENTPSTREFFAHTDFLHTLIRSRPPVGPSGRGGRPSQAPAGPLPPVARQQAHDHHARSAQFVAEKCANRECRSEKCQFGCWGRSARAARAALARMIHVGTLASDERANR